MHPGRPKISKPTPTWVMSRSSRTKRHLLIAFLTSISIEKRHFRVSNGSLDGRSREYQEPITCVVQEVSTQEERFLGDKLGGVPS